MRHLRSCFLQLQVSILIVLPVLAGNFRAMPEIGPNGIVRVKIDASGQGAAISSLLFGHNLEHT